MAPRTFTDEQMALMAPRTGDSSPASGYGRMVQHCILGELEKLIGQFQLPALDDVAEEAYNAALRPLYLLIKAQWGKEGAPLYPCEAEIKRIRLAVREFSRYRRVPTAGELQERVDEICGVERQVLSGAERQARTVVASPLGPSILGIPGTTIKAAYRGVAMPRHNDIGLGDVPTHDNEGNLIGEGRRQFLLAMHRMRGELHPSPQEERLRREARMSGPRPKEVTK